MQKMTFYFYLFFQIVLLSSCCLQSITSIRLRAQAANGNDAPTDLSILLTLQETVDSAAMPHLLHPHARDSSKQKVTSFNSLHVNYSLLVSTRQQACSPTPESSPPPNGICHVVARLHQLHPFGAYGTSLVLPAKFPTIGHLFSERRLKWRRGVVRVVSFFAMCLAGVHEACTGRRTRSASTKGHLYVHVGPCLPASGGLASWPVRTGPWMQLSQ
jgi:hypothetical protein